jgi:capsular polysaccharide biosynthesis protein
MQTETIAMILLVAIATAAIGIAIGTAIQPAYAKCSPPVMCQDSDDTHGHSSNDINGDIHSHNGHA